MNLFSKFKFIKHLYRDVKQGNFKVTTLNKRPSSFSHSPPVCSTDYMSQRWKMLIHPSAKVTAQVNARKTVIKLRYKVLRFLELS